MTQFVAYYRVSTNKQNIGLDAQRTLCTEFAKESIIAEFAEHESGKRKDRPELEKAIAMCKSKGAVLLVAKLDRLTRDLAFGATLKNSGVDFRALDCPELTPLMLGVMLGLAQQEREMISTRTKQALAELKKKGVKLGNPQCFSDKGRKMGGNTMHEKSMNNASNKRAWALVSVCMETGIKHAEIVRKLNDNGYTTPRGNAWTQTGVKNLIALMAHE